MRGSLAGARPHLGGLRANRLRTAEGRGRARSGRPGRNARRTSSGSWVSTGSTRCGRARARRGPDRCDRGRDHAVRLHPTRCARGGAEGAEQRAADRDPAVEVAKAAYEEATHLREEASTLRDREQKRQGEHALLAQQWATLAEGIEGLEEDARSRKGRLVECYLSGSKYLTRK